MTFNNNLSFVLKKKKKNKTETKNHKQHNKNVSIIISFKLISS